MRAEDTSTRGLAQNTLDTILAELTDGNRRFAYGQPLRADCSPQRRLSLLHCQRPLAAVLACSDSRVGPEMILDQSLGQLFVVRVAGNVVDDIVLGSLEYAVEHLAVPLVVVMGHSGCGAVTAACREDIENTGGPADRVLAAIMPSVIAARGTHQRVDDEMVDTGARLNVARQAQLILESKTIKDAAEQGRVAVREAWYDQQSGLVTWL